MERCLGKFPFDMVKRSSVAKEIFDEGGWHKMDLTDDKALEKLLRTHQLEDMFEWSGKDWCELLSDCLQLDPNHRILAEEALRRFNG